ncbi:MAG: helix-turn-helix transcriptional regulator [Lachnospiraceae bacterium]|nr:helix-turn-helix transcriptional regulator [Lachnospiraceae bacterium]
MVYSQLATGADFDSMTGRRDIGYVIGFGGTLSLLIQWTIQGIPGALYVAKLLLLTAVFVYVLHCIKPASPTGKDDHSTAPDGLRSKRTARGICLGAAVCCMLMLLAGYESHMNRVNFAGYFYGWTRMVTAVGYLTIGILFGRARRGAVSVAMVCIALISLISNLLMLKNGEGWWLHLALFYLVLGSLVAYYNLMFMELSAHTGNPALWAPMGRILDAGVTSVFTSIGGLLPDTDIYSLIMCLILFAGVIIFMATGGFLSMGADSVGKEGSLPATLSAMSVEERVGLFAGKYSLTPREREVFTLLVTTEDKNQDIADRLYISRRQLQNHIASIYEKTGANNRAGLLLMMDSVQDQDRQSV